MSDTRRLAVEYKARLEVAEARLAEAERLLRALYNASATGPSPARADARAFLDRQEEPK